MKDNNIIFSCKEYRKPAEYIELLIDKEVSRRAKERGMTQEAYLNKIMKDMKDNGGKNGRRK